MDKSPIFIGGLMKTGTSLLRKLMAGHPNIFGGLETFWFSEDMLHNWRDAGSKRQQFLRDFFDISESDSEGIRAQSESGIDFFDRCMWFCTQRADKQRWVEKTPDNILHMGLIREHWPKAHFLHVVRDFRDVFASWKRRDKSLDEFITKTHEVMGAVGDLAGQRTNWYAEIRYDGLVMNTEQTLKDAIEFVGEPWVEGLENYDGDNSDHQKVLQVTGKSSPTMQSLSKPIFTTSVGQWKEVLSDEEVSVLQRELGDYMTTWGWS